MPRIDFDAWDRLAEEALGVVGRHVGRAMASRLALTTILDRWSYDPSTGVGEAEFWDQLSEDGRESLLAFVCALREWAEAKGRRDAGGEP